MLLSSDSTLEKWGVETLRTIRREMYLPKSKLYVEKLGTKQPAFNWGVGVMLSALAAGARAEPSLKPWLAEYVKGTHVYWNPAGPVAGYDVLPMAKPKDRYYDDNAWMVMALVEAHEVLKDKNSLKWAREALDYCLSGQVAGEGVYWRENKKNSWNTCSNAPVAAACLSVYGETHDPKLLAKAKELYAWTKTNLQDPEDGLMWDNMTVKTRKVEKTKWTYNTGLMIRTASVLASLTNDPSYAADEKQMAAAARARWLKDGKLLDGGRFAHLLLENLARSSTEGLETPLLYLHNEAALNGHIPGSWDRPMKAGDPVELIDQASFARACFILARATRGS